MLNNIINKIIFIFGVNFVLLFGSTVYAQQETFRGLIVTVPGEETLTFEFEGRPGETFRGSFEATHDFQERNKEVKYYTYATDIEISSDQSISYPTDLSGNDRFSIFNWVEFGLDEITLNERGQNVRIPFTVTIPEDATPGSHYGALLLSNITREEYVNQTLKITPETNGASIASRIGPNIIITVEGEKTIKPIINYFDALDIEGNKPSFFGIFENLPINFVSNISNNGNVFIKPLGAINILKGQESVVSLELNPDGNRILPETTRDYESLWEDEDSGIIFGKYTANLSMTYEDVDGSPQILESTINFWIMPWRLILAGIIILMIVIAYKIYGKKDEQ